MYRLEFNESIKAVGADKSTETFIGRYGLSEDVYNWYDLKVFFGSNNYAVIKGKIPLEVANTIHKKYPDNYVDIRIDGGYDNWKPINYAIDDIYLKDIERYYEESIDDDEYRLKCKIARKKLKKRSDNDKYITTYHIDTKEGLLFFFSEMEDYYSRKNNMKETGVDRYDELLSNVTSEILKKVNPNISADDWMQQDEKNAFFYNYTIENNNKTTLEHILRMLLSAFDKAVNPYLNDEIELDEISNYLKKVKITGNTYTYKDGKEREGCCRLEITDSSTGNKTAYYRDPEGFSFQLSFKLGEDSYLQVLHFYSTNSYNEIDKGEVVVIKYYGRYPEDEIELRLNITDKKVGAANGEITPATPELIRFFNDRLIYASTYASIVTIENMRKKENDKNIIKK